MKKLLFNPFEKYNETQLFVAGLAGTIACSYIGYLFNARFDGVLDMHLTKNVTLAQPFLDNIINITSLLLFIYIAGIIINKKTRLIDILNAVLIARLPYCISPLANPEVISKGVTDKLAHIDPAKPVLPDFSGMDITALTVMGIVSIGTLVWYMALLYNGYKTATNGKKANHIVLFIVSIVLAEILSSYLIYLFN